MSIEQERASAAYLLVQDLCGQCADCFREAAGLPRTSTISVAMGMVDRLKLALEIQHEAEEAKKAKP